MCFRELLDGLRRVGFKLTLGEEDTGFLLLAFNKAGGYYFGTSICIFHHEPVHQISHSLQTLVPLN